MYFGGALIRDTQSFYIEDPHVRTILPRKRIVIEPATTLARILGDRPVRVNALHRQAIDPERLGRGVVIAARDRNRIVQAIEHRDLPLALGVQWHPEFLPQLPRQRAMFRAVVECARTSRRTATRTKPAAPLRYAAAERSAAAGSRAGAKNLCVLSAAQPAPQ